MELSTDFLVTFTDDGFVCVGSFGLRNQEMYCDFKAVPLLDAPFSLYAFVGYANGGQVLRIGESQKPVIARLKQYPRYINSSRNEALAVNQCFKGGTRPWERDIWFTYLSNYDTGLIFVKVVDFADTTQPDKRVLHKVQNDLIDKYDPACCNDRSLTNKRLRAKWEAIHGPVVEIRKRVGPIRANEARQPTSVPMQRPAPRPVRPGENIQAMTAPNTAMPSDLIRVLIKFNPKLTGSKSRLRFECYTDGMTVATYHATIRKRLGEAEARKHMPDIQFDSDRDYIYIERSGKRVVIDVAPSLRRK